MGLLMMWRREEHFEYISDSILEKILQFTPKIWIVTHKMMLQQYQIQVQQKASSKQLTTT